MNTVIALSVLIAYVFGSYKSILFYQLGGYRMRELALSLKRTRFSCLLLQLIALAPSLLYFLRPALSLFCLPSSLLCLAIEVKRSRVKLRFTPRAVRFLIVYVILSPLLFLDLPIAHVLTYFPEELRNKRFAYKKTSRLRDDNGLIRIAVTGSYGKTTAKSILVAMLSTSYKVASTQGNYNTPMGLALSSDLSQDTEAFVAELGARRKGDIAELCRLFAPTVGVVVSIGRQHLETFKTEESIRREKLSLVRYVIKNGGVAVCDRDYGVNGCHSAADECIVENVILSERGTSFTLTVAGKRVELETQLLGKHIPFMIAQCALTAIQLGVELEALKKTVKELKPLAHRLELLYNGNDVIIDDAYNANEAGAVNALELLPLFKGRVRVVITPGVVEAGKRQYEINRSIGRVAAGCCDHAFFIGRNARALCDGADGGKCNVIVVKELGAAMRELEKIKGERVVLFLNDLPDNY